VLSTTEPKRLFVTDFTCQNDIILAYAFKRYNMRNDFQLLLNLKNNLTGQYCQLVCGSDHNIEKYTLPGLKWCGLLKGIDLRKILIHLSTKQERELPSVTPINGWEVRYYYLRCEQGISAKITDIGFMTKCTEIYESHDGILLGAIHIHEGVPLYKFDDIQMVTNWDFVA